MLKHICFAIFSIALLKGSSIWEQFKEYQRSKNEHEIKLLSITADADIVKTILKDYVEGERIINVKTDSIHITINHSIDHPN